jgi:hypothetical protein
MNRFLKSAYRKEPITSFMAIAGAVDVAIGGLDRSWSLLFFGVSLVGVAIALRWWQSQNTQEELDEDSPKYFLTSQSSRPALPTLNPGKRK